MRTTQIEQLLAQQNLAGSWFSINEHLSLALMKRNLTLLRALTGFHELSLQDIEQLDEEDKAALIAAQAAAQPLAQKQRKPVPFFHTLLADSPYMSEIIQFTGQARTHMPTSPSVQVTSEATEPPRAAVHGFMLQKGEALASTRCFSKDQQSVAKIIATPTTYEAQYQNLSVDHEIDLAYEFSLHYLLSLTPQQKTTIISGPPELVYRVHAAFLTLQQAAHPRFQDLIFKLPPGMKSPSEAEQRAYCAQHLGTPNEPPRQVTQWRMFLAQQPLTTTKMDRPNAQRKTTESTTLLDMTRILNAPDLDAEDKMALNEYQRYLQHQWLQSATTSSDKPNTVMQEHETFLQRTEDMLTRLQQAPSLQLEYQRLRALYQSTLEGYQDLLEALHQNELTYEAKLNDLTANLQKAYRKSFTQSFAWVQEALTQATSDEKLSAEQHQALRQQGQGLHESAQHLEAQAKITQPMRRMYGTQMLQAIEALEVLSGFALHADLQEIKTFAREQSVAPDEELAPESDRLLQASTAVKHRLTLFKNKYPETLASGKGLDADIETLLIVLRNNLKRAELNIRERPTKDLWGKLMAQARLLSITPYMDVQKLEIFHADMELLLTKIPEASHLKSSYEELKSVLATHPIMNAPESPAAETMINRLS